MRCGPSAGASTVNRVAYRTENSAETDWMHIAPLLDEVVAQLSEKDRNAIVLRFMNENRSGRLGVFWVWTPMPRRRA